MAKIFLSHSSKDNFEAVTIVDWLKEEGWDDVFLDLDPDKGIVAGQRWENALYSQAAECEAIIFLISKNWLASDWCRKEFDLSSKLNKQAIIVIIDQTSLNELPLALRETRQLLTLGTGGDHKIFRPKLPISHEVGYVTFSQEGLRRLKTGLAHSGLDPRFFIWPPATDPQRAPYRGLEPLDKIDAGIFFGRDGPIIEALDLLRGLNQRVNPRLFVIIGASGAGKSSFLRAGLLPRLERDRSNFVVLPVLRPEDAAINGAAGFVSVVSEACVVNNLNITRSQIRDAVNGNLDGLRGYLNQIAIREDDEKKRTLILAIDQAEELFRAEYMDEGNALLKLIKNLVSIDAPPILIIFTIRSDSYDSLQNAKPLEGLSQNTYALLPMPRGAYQIVIEGPARRLRQSGRKFEIDPNFTEALLEDLEQGGGSDALPLLSFTLEQLYRDHEASHYLSKHDYAEFGGLKGAIDAAINRAFRAADTDPRIPRDYEARLALLRRGFIPWLAGVDPETKSLRRRVARASQIPEEARPLIDFLVEQRLLTRDVDKDSGEATIEPAHEALLRQWGGLKGWLEQDFANLATLEGVKRAATDWDANARDAAWAAHEGARLAESDQLDARPDLSALLNATDRAYLAACREKETALRESMEAERLAKEELEKTQLLRINERARNTKIIAYGSSGSALVGIVLSIYAWTQYSIAHQQMNAATQTANRLVSEIAHNYKDVSGVPAPLIFSILDTAHTLQEQLINHGNKDISLERSHARARIETVDACLLLGSLDCAIEAADEALNLTKSIYKKSPKNDESIHDLFTAICAMGDVEKARGNFNEALIQYNEARLLIDSTSSSHQIKDKNVIYSNVMDKIGDIRFIQGKDVEALDAYKKALDSREELYNEYSNSTEITQYLSSSYEKVADVYGSIEDFAAAKKNYDKSYEIQKKLFESNSRNTKYMVQFANILQKTGDLAYRISRYGEAKHSYEENLKIREQLTNIDPARMIWYHDLADAYVKYADNMQAQKNISLAIELYKKAEKIFINLSKNDTKNSELKRDLFGIYDRLGDISDNNGKFDEARNFYQTSVKINEDIYNIDHTDINSTKELARNYERISAIDVQLGDKTSGALFINKALSIRKNLVELQSNKLSSYLDLIEAYRMAAKIDEQNLESNIVSAYDILSIIPNKINLKDVDIRLINIIKTRLSAAGKVVPLSNVFAVSGSD